jgi:hypothetical protein
LPGNAPPFADRCSDGGAIRCEFSSVFCRPLLPDQPDQSKGLASYALGSDFGMLIGPVIVTQIVNAIVHPSMKRNQLCLRGRTMIALPSMWMLEDLRQSALSGLNSMHPRRRSSALSAKTTTQTQADVRSRVQSSPISDQVITFMLAS